MYYSTTEKIPYLPIIARGKSHTSHEQPHNSPSFHLRRSASQNAGPSGSAARSALIFFRTKRPPSPQSPCQETGSSPDKPPDLSAGPIPRSPHPIRNRAANQQPAIPKSSPIQTPCQAPSRRSDSRRKPPWLFRRPNQSPHLKPRRKPTKGLPPVLIAGCLGLHDFPGALPEF